MHAFSFNVTYVVTNVPSNNYEYGNLPITVEADNYEEARSKALEFGQSVARCYILSDFETFYFLITKK